MRFKVGYILPITKSDRDLNIDHDRYSSKTISRSLDVRLPRRKPADRKTGEGSAAKRGATPNTIIQIAIPAESPHRPASKWTSHVDLPA